MFPILKNIPFFCFPIVAKTNKKSRLNNQVEEEEDSSSVFPSISNTSYICNTLREVHSTKSNTK